MTKERPLTLLEMFQQGMTNQEIADKTSKTNNAISIARGRLINTGVLDKKFKSLRLYKDNSNTSGYLKEGYTFKEICELTSKAQGTISYHIKKINDLNLIEKPAGQMLEAIQQIETPEQIRAEIFKGTKYQYPPECVTGGRRAAYTRKLRSQEKAPKITTPKPPKDIVKSNSDLLFIVNGVSVTVHHNSLKNVFVGKDKIVVNF